MLHGKKSMLFFFFIIVGQSEWKNLHSQISTPQFSPGKHVHSEVSFQAAAKPCVWANICHEEKIMKEDNRLPLQPANLDFKALCENKLSHQNNNETNFQQESPSKEVTDFNY